MIYQKEPPPLRAKTNTPTLANADNEHIKMTNVFFVYSSILGDIRLWVGPRIEHLLSTWDLTRDPESINGEKLRTHGVSCSLPTVKNQEPA